MARSTWTERDIPDLAGRRAIVTGASSGIGLEASRLLAAAGAEVVLAVRDPARGRRAVEEITRTVPEARLAVAEIDLSELDSVRRFGRREVELARGLDMLINNAGTSGGPRRASADGFEIQMATNFLGHFALTGLLLPLLHPGGRIVTVASLMARRGHLSAATTLEDLRPREPYRAGRCYADSKQADLLFAVELGRRLRAAGSDILSVACHPGGAATGLGSQRARAAGRPERLTIGARLMRLVLQSARAGAWPTVFAATAPGLVGGELVAPDGIAQGRGRPRVVPVFASGRDAAVAARLWELGREATGVEFGGI
ncbi:MAG TPA: oxidoreductase [Solirubrobacteraceae bacterium]|jgi:NAD(P)-dependent dehydrogenase (short-subunit alcohol dehydrogenase family)